MDLAAALRPARPGGGWLLAVPAPLSALSLTTEADVQTLFVEHRRDLLANDGPLYVPRRVHALRLRLNRPANLHAAEVYAAGQAQTLWAALAAPPAARCSALLQSALVSGALSSAELLAAALLAVAPQPTHDLPRDLVRIALGEAPDGPEREPLLRDALRAVCLLHDVLELMGDQLVARRSAGLVPPGAKKMSEPKANGLALKPAAAAPAWPPVWIFTSAKSSPKAAPIRERTASGNGAPCEKASASTVGARTGVGPARAANATPWTGAGESATGPAPGVAAGVATAGAAAAGAAAAGAAAGVPPPPPPTPLSASRFWISSFWASVAFSSVSPASVTPGRALLEEYAVLANLIRLP